jgi:hypothetical protein
VLISVTGFKVTRLRDMPGVWLAGVRLRRAWPQLEGAVGLWLWTEPFKRRGGSISVWESEDDLLQFVRWPVHVAIMRKYRKRGSLRSTTWEADRLVLSDVWREAKLRLARWA